MFTGVPNLAYVFGYFRASWTLRADLISDFVCRLLAHMDEIGASMVVPVRRRPTASCARGSTPTTSTPATSRARMHLMPKQGARAPWRLEHDYMLEKEILPTADLDDGTLEYR